MLVCDQNLLSTCDAGDQMLATSDLCDQCGVCGQATPPFLGPCDRFIATVTLA